MSSLHVRARTGCASAASSLCLGLHPVVVAFPEERKPSTGSSHAPSPGPSRDPVGRTQASIHHPGCAPTGKIIQHICVSSFSPGKVQGWPLTCTVAHVQGPGPGQPCNYQGDRQSSRQASTQGAVEAVLPPCQWSPPKEGFFSLKQDHDPTDQPPGECKSPLLSPHCGL